LNKEDTIDPKKRGEMLMRGKKYDASGKRLLFKSKEEAADDNKLDIHDF